MKTEFRNLRVRQIARGLEPFAVKAIPRPERGWIRAIREVSGITLREVGQKMDVSTQFAAALEKSEAEYRITLKSLRKAAEALGCELVYALVPKQGSIRDLIEARVRAKASGDVLAVEHTMALEDQAVGGVDEKIEEEARRISKTL